MSLFGLPLWLEYLFAGLFLMHLMVTTGIILGRTGVSPAWALILLLPFAQIIGIWYFAYMVWPRHKKTAAP